MLSTTVFDSKHSPRFLTSRTFAAGVSDEPSEAQLAAAWEPRCEVEAGLLVDEGQDPALWGPWADQDVWTVTPDLDQDHADHEDWLAGYTDLPQAFDALRAAKIEANAREDRSGAAYEAIRSARSKGQLGLISSAVAWAIVHDLYPRD